MNIKLVNNLGTLIYTLFKGKEVGKDKLGNRYFISKNKPFRKWVLYKNNKNDNKSKKEAPGPSYSNSA